MIVAMEYNRWIFCVCYIVSQVLYVNTQDLCTASQPDAGGYIGNGPGTSVVTAGMRKCVIFDDYDLPAGELQGFRFSTDTSETGLKLQIWRPNVTSNRLFELVHETIPTITAPGQYEVSPSSLFYTHKCDKLGFTNLVDRSSILHTYAPTITGSVNSVFDHGGNLPQLGNNYLFFVGFYDSRAFALEVKVDSDSTTSAPSPTSPTTNPYQGPPGLQGDVGPPGLKGEAGDSGTKGDPGQKGEIGLQGSKGDQGDKGGVGLSGPLGDIGDQGPQGEDGAKGDLGPRGPEGVKGDTGPRGDAGAQGLPGLAGNASGPPGPPGANGQKGEKGELGTRGPTGERGPSGTPGNKGEKGTEGIDGSKGEVGLEGEKGDIGPLGPQGPPGPLGPGSYDIDECADNDGGCQQRCVNVFGSYNCDCNTGYQLNSNGVTCADINECLKDNGGCEHTCENSDGSFACSCREQYQLANNRINCDDFNECAVNNGGCGDRTCANTIGSRLCLNAGDGTGGSSASGQTGTGATESILNGNVILGLFIWAAVLTALLVLLIILVCVKYSESKKREQFMRQYIRENAEKASNYSDRTIDRAHPGYTLPRLSVDKR